MADSLIPYTFVPGTKARANEINANFTAVADAINSSNASVTDLSNEMTTAINSRLDLNLSNTHHFTNCIIAAPNGVATCSGSTITVKSGLKVLIPNGKNSDKTLKNIEYIFQADLTYTEVSSAENKDLVLYYNKNTNTLGAATECYTQAEIPSTSPDSCIWLKTGENIFYNLPSGGLSWVSQTPNLVTLARFSRANGVITELKPYDVISFSAMANCDLSNLTPESNYNVLKPSAYQMRLSATGLIAKCGTRGYYKSYSDECFCAIGVSAGYSAPIFVSETERGATCYDDYNTTPHVSGTLEYFGKTWYYFWEHPMPISDGYSKYNNRIPIMPMQASDPTQMAQWVLWMYHASTEYAIPYFSYIDGTNGYRVWGDGFIEQWGQTGQIGAGGSAVITMPRAFSNTHFQVVACATQDSNNYANASIVGKSATTFTLRNISNANSNCNFMWIAMGY